MYYKSQNIWEQNILDDLLGGGGFFRGNQNIFLLIF